MAYSTIRIVTEDPETAAITITTSTINPITEYTVNVHGIDRVITSKELTTDQECSIQELVEKGQAKSRIIESEEAYAKRVVAVFLASDPGRVFLTIVEQEDIDNLFKNIMPHFYEALGWDDVQKTLKFDIKRARWIHMRHLREQRKKIFEQLDKEAIKMLEEGNQEQLQKIVERKRRYRSMPQILGPTLEKCSTVRELSAVTVDWVDALSL